ncbi:ABC transporter [Streptomyces pactum]|uniref:ABC transporter n=1 Tax=Streptomyces pactum TaxID=68249 RepID=A0ABS0NQM3_9ACTN|nr:ABC transporter [Streptomyces pactum]MBH5337508.1 ABC transporter [Streptomyces pactum]
MLPLIRYRTALLLRSQRWLPPLLLYVAFLAVGVRAGGPVLDSLGYAAACLVPAAAWLVRVATTGEPAAARYCVAASAGPGRSHLAGLLAALLCTTVAGTAGTLVVAAISDPHGSDRQTPVPAAEAVAAGLAAMLVCALLGAAAGALCNPPVLHRPGRAVPATLLGALLVLLVAGSPANAAVSGLVGGSHSAAVPMPWGPLAAATALAGGAVTVACRLSSRRA